jgi:acyl-CoA synthetase (AMP-forming)/AMP-acid ligase II
MTAQQAIPRHFVEVIQRHAYERPDSLAYRFLRREVEAETLSFAQLDQAARAVAGALSGHEGERAMLLFPPGLGFVKTFLGCWYAGIVPVPCSPPTREHEVERLLRVARDADVRFVLTVAPLAELVRSQLAERGLSRVACLDADELLRAPVEPWSDPGLSPQTIALLQYTSGSTSEPKGVVVSHANLVHNQRAIKELFGHDENTRVVGWLPLYHDMGLIGNVLQPLWLGRDVTLMSPVDFMMRPLSWLRAISRYRATTSGGPNFAYELCTEAANPEALAGLDLSCWTLAYNGAEPIRQSTLERFYEAFAPAGLRRETLYPCYGLAESTLIVTGARRPFLTRHYEAGALAAHQAISVGAGVVGAVPLVSSGVPAEGTRLCIVDPETLAPCREGFVGEIWVSSPSVAQSYWRQSEASEETFAARLKGRDGAWLRTGDLGFLDAGELFVTGRLKDLIIVRGRNHHPQDIEETCWTSHPALRVGRAAAFTLDDSPEGEGSLVVVQEVQKGSAAFDQAELLARVRTQISQKHGLALSALVLVRSGQVPKTSSGKVRRRECRRLYQEKALQPFTPEDA